MNKKGFSLICFLIICTSIFLVWNKDSNKVTILDEVRLKDIEKNNGMFAVYIRDNKDAEYQEYKDDNNLIPEGYKLDLDESGCVDGNGEKVTTDGIITQTADNKITLKSNKTVYCYLYFEKNSFNGTGSDLAQSESKGLMATPGKGDLAYRYVGTKDDVENYICFGTTNNCYGENTAEENYQYRIIGVDTSGRLKLIKDTAISTSTQWHNKYKSSDCSSVECTWDKSTMYQYLNTDTSGFYANSNNTYVPTDWKYKIDKTKWNIGDVNGDSYAQSGDAIFAQEQTISAATSSEIGLMYLSDYYYSLAGEEKTNCRSDSATCKTSWLHISNNSTSQNKTEWTMTRYGYNSSLGNYRAWRVDYDGYVNYSSLNSTDAARPVFYLKSDTTISSGTGTLDDPYILSGN